MIIIWWKIDFCPYWAKDWIFLPFNKLMGTKNVLSSIESTWKGICIKTNDHVKFHDNLIHNFWYTKRQFFHSKLPERGQRYKIRAVTILPRENPCRKVLKTRSRQIWKTRNFENLVRKFTLKIFYLETLGFEHPVNH